MSKHRRVEGMSEIWVKGYKDKDGDIIISLGDDGFHIIEKRHVEWGDVEVKEVWQQKKSKSMLTSWVL